MTAAPPLVVLRTLRAETLTLAHQIHAHLARIEATMRAMGERPARVRLPAAAVHPGIALRARRRALGLTLCDLAEHVNGLTASAIGAIERGASANSQSIELIVRALDQLEEAR